MMVEVRNSPIHGRGCFAIQRICSGTRILEYTGRRISLKEANERYWERPSTYLFSLADGTVIDGIGSASLVNHCCEPNCQAEEHDGHVWIRALRDIEAGEELTLDYGLKNSGSRAMPCHCGKRNCRGSLFSADEMERRSQRGQIDVMGASSEPSRPRSSRRDNERKARQRG